MGSSPPRYPKPTVPGQWPCSVHPVPVYPRGTFSDAQDKISELCFSDLKSTINFRQRLSDASLGLCTLSATIFQSHDSGLLSLPHPVVVTVVSQGPTPCLPGSSK